MDEAREMRAQVYLRDQVQVRTRSPKPYVACLFRAMYNCRLLTRTLTPVLKKCCLRMCTTGRVPGSKFPSNGDGFTTAYEVCKFAGTKIEVIPTALPDQNGDCRW